jgi:hypothetical protein
MTKDKVANPMPPAPPVKDGKLDGKPDETPKKSEEPRMEVDPEVRKLEVVNDMTDYIKVSGGYIHKSNYRK